MAGRAQDVQVIDRVRPPFVFRYDMAPLKAQRIAASKAIVAMYVPKFLAT